MLPVIEHPINTFTIPSTKKEVRVRPYLAKEEKILLMAKETKNSLEILGAVKQIINNCLIDNDVNVNKLTTFDIEYLFLKLYAISVKNIIHIELIDTEEQPDEKGEKRAYPFDIDLMKIEVQFPEKIENKIKINDKVGIIMKYLSMDIPAEVYAKGSATEVLMELIKLCIDKVWSGEELFNFQEQEDNEKTQFIDSLSHQTLEDLADFFRSVPRISYTMKYVNKLGHNREKRLEKLDDFFMFR